MHYTAQTFGKKMKACEGDTFEELSTHIIYTYHDGFWYPPLVEAPSTPETGSVEPDPIQPVEVIVEKSEAISQDETPKSVVEEPKPKKSRKKKETKE